MFVVWDIVLIFDSKKFARKYALIYTAVLAVLLIVPLVTYILLLLQIDEAKVKLSLESQAKKIIVSMQRYKNSDQVYYFPRYKEYKAALLDSKYCLKNKHRLKPIAFIGNTCYNSYIDFHRL